MRNELITFTSPKASVSEVFRTLRTNIQFMNVNNKLKSLLVTSTVPGEGKSWVSANLAITFAQAGKRVVLVDADMRKGRQHELFEVSNENGLSNYLITASDTKVDLADYIKPTLIENLYIITAGIVPPNPSELLTSKKMSDLIKALEKSADIVIFDGTPSTMPIAHKKYENKYYYESSMVLNKKKNWFSNILKHTESIQEKEIPKVKKNLDIVAKAENKLEKQKSEKITKKKEAEKSNEEDIDINAVLKQLTKYLSEEKK